MSVRADVLRAQAGDREAFARLYRAFARPVLLDLAARLGNGADAEDALQATFLSAWQNLSRLRRPERFSAWLFRIARNKARDLGRRKRLRLLGLERLDPPAPVHPDRPELERVRRLLDGLRPSTRALVLLRAVEGWSAEAIASAYRISPSTVRRRYARALAHLRAGLRAETRSLRHADGTPRTARGFGI